MNGERKNWFDKLKEKMTVTRTRTLCNVIVAVFVLLVIVGEALSSGYALAAGMFLLLAFVAVKCLFWRCPHCGEHLGRDVGEYCTHCGEKLEK